LGPLIMLLLASLALIAGGLSLIFGGGGALCWVLAATLLSFLVASTDTWVLLVEILRGPASNCRISKSRTSWRVIQRTNGPLLARHRDSH
jgi:hypothetical protein